MSSCISNLIPNEAELAYWLMDRSVKLANKQANNSCLSKFAVSSEIYFGEKIYAITLVVISVLNSIRFAVGAVLDFATQGVKFNVSNAFKALGTGLLNTVKSLASAVVIAIAFIISFVWLRVFKTLAQAPQPLGWALEYKNKLDASARELQKNLENSNQNNKELNEQLSNLKPQLEKALRDLEAATNNFSAQQQAHASIIQSTELTASLKFSQLTNDHKEQEQVVLAKQKELNDLQAAIAQAEQKNTGILTAKDKRLKELESTLTDEQAKLTEIILKEKQSVKTLTANQSRLEHLSGDLTRKLTEIAQSISMCEVDVFSLKISSEQIDKMLPEWEKGKLKGSKKEELKASIVTLIGRWNILHVKLIALNALAGLPSPKPETSSSSSASSSSLSSSSSSSSLSSASLPASSSSSSSPRPAPLDMAAISLSHAAVNPPTSSLPHATISPPTSPSLGIKPKILFKS